MYCLCLWLLALWSVLLSNTLLLAYTTCIDIDKSSSRLTVILKDTPSKRIRELDHAAEEWLATNAPNFSPKRSTGPTALFAYISKRNILGMANGVLLGLFIITIIMILSLKSIRYGILSLVPNTAPIVIALGFWYYIYGMADLAVSVVASVTFGIIVDDTIHLLNRFITLKRQGKNNLDALMQTMEKVGQALISTSFVLSLGFMVLMTSNFLLNYTLGLLSTITILIALAFDLLVLPAILLKVARVFSPAEEREPLTVGSRVAGILNREQTQPNK